MSIDRLGWALAMCTGLVAGCGDVAAGEGGRQPTALASPEPPSPSAGSTLRTWFDRDLVLDGFFRPGVTSFDPTVVNLLPDPEQPWVPAPAAADARSRGETLPREYWVDPAAVRALVAAGQRAPAERVNTLTAGLRITPTGRLDIDYSGASTGLMAIRAGKTTKGVKSTQWAVEAASEEPFEFVTGGVPAPRSDSLVLEFTEYLNPHVATRLTIKSPNQGVILCEQGTDGALTLAPGRPSSETQAAR